MLGLVHSPAGRSVPGSHGNANEVGYPNAVGGYPNAVAYQLGRSYSVVVTDGTRGRRGMVHGERYVVPGF